MAPCVCAAAFLASAPAAFAQRDVTLSVSQDKTHYTVDEQIRLSYELSDGEVNPFKDVKRSDAFMVGVRGYLGFFDTLAGKLNFTMSDALKGIVAKRITALGSGEFNIPAKAIPFSMDFHRHAGFTNEDVFFIRRELSVPPDLLRSDKTRYEVGEPITITVNDSVSFLKDEQWLAPDSEERPIIEIWRAPREVPGGAVELPERIWQMEPPAKRDKGAVKGFRVTINKREQDDWPFRHISNHGYLPHGHYDVLLSIRGTHIAKLTGGIEIVGPAREQVQAMRLAPELEEDEHNEQGVPVYDELPELLVNDGIKPHYLKQGSIGIYRVGAHGELREVQYHWGHSGAQMGDGRSWLNANTVPAPGLYEARYYFGGEDNANGGKMLLHSMRFMLSPKAVKVGDETATAPLPQESLRLSASKAGPYHIGETITLRLTRDEAQKDALAHSNLWVSLRRLGQYYSQCAYEEEYDTEPPLQIQQGSRRATTNPNGLFAAQFAEMENNLANTINIPPMEIPAYGEAARTPQQRALPVTKRDAQIKRVQYDEASGTLTLNPPDAPGRYAVDIYRSDSAERTQGMGEKFHDYERVHRFEFEIEARRFAGLLGGDVPDALAKSDTYVAQYEARHLLPGGLKTYMFGKALVTEGPLTATNRPQMAYRPARRDMANHDYNLRRAVLNNYLLDESAPFRILEGEHLAYLMGLRNHYLPDALPEMPDDWPQQYLTQTTPWEDLVIPQEAWLMDADVCHNEPLPDFELRLVRLDGARDVKDSAEWQDRRYGLLDFDAMEYEELDTPYIGYPFFIEAEFDAPPASKRVRAEVTIGEGEARIVWLVRSEDDASIYRSERAHFVGANYGLEEE